MLKTIQAINSLLTTLVALGIFAILAVASWFGYHTYFGREEAEKKLAAREAEIEGLKGDLQERDKQIVSLNKEVSRLDTANRLLKIDHRVAYVDVLSQQAGKDGELATKFSFVEVDQQGKPLENPRVFSVKGDMIHIDAFLVHFSDKSVEEGDPLRSTSLCLFKRIYGDKQKPEEAFAVDPVGSQPAAYRGGKEVSDLEREIWGKFWEIANDAKKAGEMGVRSAGGEGVWHKVVPGKRYKILLRASGGLSVTPEDLPVKPTEPTL